MEKHNEDTIADLMLSYKAENPTYLDRIKALIDWKPIEKILKKKYKWTKNAAGNSAYSPLIMFRILLVQSWEKLSDPQMEFALNDRLSVIRFVGLSVMGKVPDHSTICRFRNRLIELNILVAVNLKKAARMMSLGS